MQMPSRFQISCVIMALAVFSSYADSQTFSPTGSLALPLAYQTATPLQDGTVLIAGGDNNSGITATFEIYNPSTGTITQAGSMNVARYSATATPLADGTVLIAGGSGDKSAEIYSGGTFSKLSAIMTAVRYNATATPLQDGTVLIAGGDTGNWAGTTSAEIYNPATHTFTATTGSMSTRRTCHTAALLTDGTVLIAGGQGNYSGQTAWNTAEIYNPSTQQFTTVGTMTSARYYHTATLLSDGTVLIAGGHNNQSQTVVSSAEIYSPSSKSFAGTGSMHYIRELHTATALDDGTVLVAGGSDGTSSELNSAEVYTPSSKTFATTTSMSAQRAHHTATLLANGEVLIAGGVYNMENPPQQFLSSADLYSYPFTSSVIYPAYQVTSILYAAPGNKSQSGYTSTTTNATTTTIGSNFTEGSSITFTEGFGDCKTGCGSASEGFGTASTTTNSTAFQESYSWATGVANQSSSSLPDAIDHNQDQLLIWLNPQITVNGGEVTPVSYNVGVQPTSQTQTPLPDIIQVSAGAMEPNPGNIPDVPIGSSSVPAGWLNQQNTAQGYEPGLASICKNLIKSEYDTLNCTKADQCGCTPADFLPILKQDPLLFYNGLTNPVSPYPGTVSPLEANTPSGNFSDANCGTLPTPDLTSSSCRFVPVPDTGGSSNQKNPKLPGPDDPEFNNQPDSFQLGENQQRTQTLGSQTQESVSFSLKLGTSVFSMTNQDTWTWTQSQSLGTASGSGYTQAVSLSSSTDGCSEYVPIFEDTLYHTLVFQENPNPGSTCASNVPTFSVTATSPSQTTPLSLGHSMTYTVAVTAMYGFSGTVGLSVSGLPTGVTASFNPASVSTSTVGNATLTLTAVYSNSTYVGTSTVTVTGTSGGSAQSTAFVLTTQPLQYRGYCNVQ